MARIKTQPTETVTARTPHTCSICERTIEPGETYTRRFLDNHNGQPRIIKKCKDGH